MIQVSCGRGKGDLVRSPRGLHGGDRATNGIPPIGDEFHLATATGYELAKCHR